MNCTMNTTANSIVNSVVETLKKIEGFPLFLHNLKKKAKTPADVEDVVVHIPRKCENEAREGRSHCAVMSLCLGRDYMPNNAIDLPPSQLFGLGKKVYDWCEEAGLRPSIDYWANSKMNSGFNIVVHF